jgi:hypothetical protein
MTSVAILLILLPTGLALGYHRYIGARATRHVSIEVACLSLDQIVDIGTKSSTSMVKRTVGRPQPYAAADGAVEWRTQSKGGVMLYRVLPLPDYLGFRVESWATTVTITRMQGSQICCAGAAARWRRSPARACPFPRPLSSSRKRQKQ